MNFRKYLGLIVGCGLALLAAIGAGVLLYFSLTGHGKAQEALKSEQGKLAQLNKRKPFPIRSNVELSEAKLASLNGVLSNTVARLAKGQVEVDRIEPAEFAPLLERTLNQLRKQASNNVVQLPNGFAFGFDRYSAGDIPSSNNVPRLVLQLKSMARLCDVFFAAKVSNITAVVREDFESAAGAAPGGMSGMRMVAGGEFGGAVGGASMASIKDIPAAASNELFAAERFQIAVSGRENSIWEVLNALVSGSLFTVVRDVQLDSVTAGLKTDPAMGRGPAGGLPPGLNMAAMERMLGGPPGGLPAGLGQQPQMTSTNVVFPQREDRVVAGRETVRMTLVVDVYRFATAKEESK